jgi:DNA-binding transcriptional regulator YhcF (GntR family)
MTDMQMLYLKTRAEQHCGHRAALRQMAARTKIDPDTIDRVLQRARRADAIDAKRAKKAVA